MRIRADFDILQGAIQHIALDHDHLASPLFNHLTNIESQLQQICSQVLVRSDIQSHVEQECQMWRDRLTDISHLFQGLTDHLQQELDLLELEQINASRGLGAKVE